MIGLCDCNNFFVSCERLFNPALEGRPVIVVGSNDGCVVARSNEAKALGIKMSQPLFQIRDLVARHRVTTISSNLTLYGDISQRIMATLRREIPSIEIYSIDEAFLDLSGVEEQELHALARRVVERVRRDIGMPVSVGIAPTKTLAKVATDLCKRYPKLRSVCVMRREEDIAKVMHSYPVRDVWGIGRRSTAMLGSYNITTAEQFRNAPKGWISAKMGVVGLRIWRELWGESCIKIDNTPSARQSIMVSRSFRHEIEDVESLSRTIATFASQTCEKLRRQHSLAAQVEVFIRTNPHREDHPQHNVERVGMLSTPTDSTLEIVKMATAMLRELFFKGYKYKRAGVVLSNITPNQGVQRSMFDTIERDKHKALMETMDRLNQEMGRGAIVVGAQGEGVAPSRKENSSPNYTTSWEDIISVKV